MLFSSSVTRRTLTDASILVYKFRPERTGFNMYATYTRPQLTFLANATSWLPWLHLFLNVIFSLLPNHLSKVVMADGQIQPSDPHISKVSVRHYRLILCG